VPHDDGCDHDGDPDVTEVEAFYYPDRGGFVGTVLAQGAWDPRTQTGVAVLALLGHVLEDLPTLTPMTLTRITVDMVRPVPIHRRLEIVPAVVREGKKLQVLDLTLVVDEVEHARARVLRLRDEDVSDRPGMPASTTTDDPAAALQPPDDIEPLERADGPGMMRAVDLRRARLGGSEAHGFWMRLRVPVVAGEPVRPTALQTVAVDFANCIGVALDPRAASTINPDVSGQFLRVPTGEWIAIVGDTRFDHTLGRGFSAATLSDRDGVFAMATTSQLVQPMTAVA
jgi:hypothetical protein